MTNSERARVRAQHAGLTPLWDELARRMGASARPIAHVRLRGLTDTERAAIADLLGWDRLPPAQARLATAAIARALGLDPDAPAELRMLVERLRGPLPNRARAREEHRAAREALWAWLGERVAARRLDAWVARVRAAGVPGDDVAAHRRRLEQVVSVLERLPADGISLPRLARETCHDPHGLSYGTWASGVVLEAIAQCQDRPAPRTAAEARELWLEMGVLADSLSPSVLVLGLHAHGDDPLARTLRAMAAAGEPVAVTLSQLQRWPLCPARTAVYAFENPSILMEAAARGWTGGPPLICTAGWPNTAVVTLLSRLSTAGCVVYSHGDFDAAGLRITQELAARTGAIPWRMSAADYLAAAEHALIQLADSVPDAPWDTALAPAIRARGRVVFEEAVAADLLESLRAAGPPLPR